MFQTEAKESEGKKTRTYKVANANSRKNENRKFEHNVYADLNRSNANTGINKGENV